MLVVFCKKENKLTSQRFKAAAERRHSAFFPPAQRWMLDRRN